MLKIFLSKNLGAEKANYRYLLRESILNNIESSLNIDTKGILDLERIPKIEGYALSISHAQKIGGFALSENSKSIGFDIEETERISKDTVLRICAADEKFPSHDFMWVAKEAAFKAIGNGVLTPKPSVVSEVKITDWQRVDIDAFTFKFNLGVGKVWHLDGYTLGIAKCMDSNPESHFDTVKVEILN